MTEEFDVAPRFDTPYHVEISGTEKINCIPVIKVNDNSLFEEFELLAEYPYLLK